MKRVISTPFGYDQGSAVGEQSRLRATGADFYCYKGVDPV
ncbi:hypothetical protein FACS1894172_21010 [Spirochaetia bacterium]|nr:hypothetical protein FACS1894172_21010 [Spirochaetia bacterium]